MASPEFYKYNIDNPQEVVRLSEWEELELPKGMTDDLIPIIESNYPIRNEKAHIFIIEEPHDSFEGQINVYRGLKTFFDHHDLLPRKTVFLAEGHEQNIEVDLSPLLSDKTPSHKQIDEILKTFSITGYMALLWKEHYGIHVVGTEDKVRYEMSSFLVNRLHHQGMENLMYEEAKRLDGWNEWMLSICSRNKAMVDTVDYQLNQLKIPFLFVGGGHLQGMDNYNFQRIKESANYNVLGPFGPFYHVVKGFQHTDVMGIIDLLRKRHIGFTFFGQRSEIEKANDIQQYMDYFSEQNKTGKDNLYIDKEFIDRKLKREQSLVKKTTISSNRNDARSARRYTENRGNIYERRYEYYDTNWIQRGQAEVQNFLDRPSLWSNPSPVGRGWDYEALVGVNIGGTHPVIDDYYFSGGIATSMKTLDTNASSYYEDPKRILYVGKDYVDSFFSERFMKQGVQMHDGRHIPYNEVRGFNLEIAVPSSGLAFGRMDQLRQIQEYGDSKNVTVVIAEVP